MPRISHPNKLPQVILIFGVIILLAAAGVVVVRVFSVEDTWIQDKETGAWVRHGNPQGPAPSTAVADCYARAAGASYDAALASCLGILCANDQICINDLLDRFETLRNNAKDQALEGNIPAIAPSQPSSATEDSYSPPGTPQVEEELQPSAPSVSAVSATSSLRVAAPAVNAELTSPFKITGEVQQDVKSLTVNIKGANNETLITETVTPRAEAVEGWRPFKLTLSYEFSRTKQGTVEILPDGKADDMVVIPVVFN